MNPGFHEAATGLPCRNIDIWAMRPGTIANILSKTANGTDLIIGEGVMGLFDGAAGGGGSTADLATELGLPTILVVDASGQSISAAAVIHGFNTFRDDLKIGSVIFNRVGSSCSGHAPGADRDLEIPVFGYLPRDDRRSQAPPPRSGAGGRGADASIVFSKDLPRRCPHTWIWTELPWTSTVENPFPSHLKVAQPFCHWLKAVSIAQDVAFPFTYPHIIDNWHRFWGRGQLFRLSNEPRGECGCVLPGGYPELHAGQLANQYTVYGRNARGCKRRPSDLRWRVYGSRRWTDRRAWRTTRNVWLAACHVVRETASSSRLPRCGTSPAPRWGWGTRFRGHEFHYATVVEEGEEDPLFQCCDSTGEVTSLIGRRVANVSGSFLHLIDRYS